MGVVIQADGEQKEYSGDKTIGDLKREMGWPDSDVVVVNGRVAADKDRLEHFEDGSTITHVPPGGMENG